MPKRRRGPHRPTELVGILKAHGASRNHAAAQRWCAPASFWDSLSWEASSLVLLVDPIVSGGNASEANAGIMFLISLIFVAPFSLLAFLCAFIAHLAVKGAERDQGR